MNFYTDTKYTIFLSTHYSLHIPSRNNFIHARHGSWMIYLRTISGIYCSKLIKPPIKRKLAKIFYRSHNAFGVRFDTSNSVFQWLVISFYYARAYIIKNHDLLIFICFSTLTIIISQQLLGDIFYYSLLK